MSRPYLNGRIPVRPGALLEWKVDFKRYSVLMLLLVRALQIELARALLDHDRKRLCERVREFARHKPAAV